MGSRLTTAETPTETASAAADVALSDEDAELAELARQIAELDAAEAAERAKAEEVDEAAPAADDKVN